MKTIHSLLLTCALLLTGSMIAAAQGPFEGFADSTQQKNHFKPIPISPEKSARTSVSQMDSVLNLSEKQQTKLYKMLLKWAREDSQYIMPNQGGGFGGGMGMPPRGMGGGMGMPPGGDMGGGMGMPPGGGMGGGMGMPPQGFGQGSSRRGDMNIEELQKQMEKKMNQREKKIKKALTEDQYDLWVSKDRPGFPAMKPIEPRRNDMDWEDFINSME